MKSRRKTGHLITEGINPITKAIDKKSTLEIIGVISREDKKIARAVSKERKNIARAVELAVTRLEIGRAHV